MSLNITVVNIKNSAPRVGVTRIYIGRSGYGRQGSPLANPYAIGGDDDRAEVLAKYTRWLWYATGVPIYSVVNELHRIKQLAEHGPVELECWCKPEPCHGDIIKRFVEEEI